METERSLKLLSKGRNSRRRGENSVGLWIMVMESVSLNRKSILSVSTFPTQLFLLQKNSGCRFSSMKAIEISGEYHICLPIVWYSQ